MAMTVDAATFAPLATDAMAVAQAWDSLSWGQRRKLTRNFPVLAAACERSSKDGKRLGGKMKEHRREAEGSFSLASMVSSR